MKNRIVLVLLGIALISTSTSLPAVEADTKGATPGKWTMDLKSAQKMAKKKNMAILLNFSGSDWCGWCKLMDRNVFASKEWTDYAKENVMMVLIDFPNDKSLVPKEFTKRNSELQKKYGVEGFPTFVLLDSDGSTLLGSTGASREKTGKSFSAEINRFLQYSSIGVAKYTKNLKSKNKARYLEIIKQINESSDTIKDLKEQMAAAEKKIIETEEALNKLKVSAQRFRAEQMGKDELAEFNKLRQDLDREEANLLAWIKTQPQRNEANMKKHQEMMGRIQGLMEKLSKY